MSSEVDICNLALSNLGDSATISSIDPPEGSPQAEHCATFYPMARDALLQEESWTFATKRFKLAQLDVEWPVWGYCYAKPMDCLHMRAIVPATAAPGVPDHYQQFVIELNAADKEVVYTNQELAYGVYTKRLTDTQRFSPLFVIALGWRLAAMIAGPMIKGEKGHAEALRCLKMAEMWKSRAVAADLNQQYVQIEHIPDSIKARR